MAAQYVDRMSVDVRGEGDALLFIHGLGGSMNAWTPLLPALSRHRCVRVEMPGSARSNAAYLLDEHTPHKGQLTIFALLFPNVAGNVCNFIWSDPGDRFHVAKFPMMCPHSILHCKLKGWVAMMGRLIYTMDKWWPIVTAFQVNAVTGSTVFLVQGFSCYGIGHQPGTWRGELYILCMGRKTGCPEKS